MFNFDREEAKAYFQYAESCLSQACNHLNNGGNDDFGFDPHYLKRFVPFLAGLYRYYFRCQVFGIERLVDGPALIVANHSGQLPYDAAMIATAVVLERKPPRMVRAMVDRLVPSLPFIGPMMSRCGQVLGTPKNCRRLLQAGELLQIFPEGSSGLNKTYDQRYTLQRFGSGFLRLAIENQVPIIPVAVIGAEEQAPSFHNFKSLAKVFGLPALPLTPAPFFGLLPLPAQYTLYFGDPLWFDGHANDEDEVVHAKVGKVRGVLEQMLQDGLAKRQRVFW